MKEQDKKQTIEFAEDQQHDLLGRLLRMAGGRTAVPEEASQRVKSRVHAHWQQSVRSRSRKKFIYSVGGLIAASFFLYVVAWLFLTGETPQPMPIGIVERITGNALEIKKINDDATVHNVTRGSILISGSSVETDNAGRLLIRLLQGVSIRLDVNTKIVFDSRSRFVLEHGAAYLDCGKSAAPIALVTSLGTVTDEGTQFEVRLQNREMRIRVREGAVLLRQESQNPRTISAGKQLNVSETGTTSESRIEPFGMPWDWTSEVAPPYQLEGRSLMEFLEWITRENGWRLDFAEHRVRSAAPDIILHGSVDGLRPDQMPDAVLPVCGLSYTLNDGTLTVKSGKRT